MPLASPGITDLLVRQAQLEAALTGVQAILEAEPRTAEELRTERDRWAAQAERLALPAPQARKRRAAGWSAWFRQPLVAS